MAIPNSDNVVKIAPPLAVPDYAMILERYKGIDPTLTRLPVKEAAILTGLAVKTLEAMRGEGRGPIFMKLGGRVFYRLSDLLAFMNQNRFVSTREAKAARAGELR